MLLNISDIPPGIKGVTWNRENNFTLNNRLSVKCIDKPLLEAYLKSMTLELSKKNNCAWGDPFFDYKTTLSVEKLFLVGIDFTL